MKNLLITILFLTASPLIAQWQSSQEIDEIDDSKNTYFSLYASSGQNVYGKSPILVVSKTDGEFNVYIIFNEYFSDDDTNITIRYDKELALEEEWIISSDNTSLFCPTQSDLIAKLLTIKKLKIRATPYEGNEITCVFDVSGLDKEFKKFGITLK